MRVSFLYVVIGGVIVRGSQALTPSPTIPTYSYLIASTGSSRAACQEG